MSWNNIAAINSSENWQLSPQFTGEIIRLRHSVGGDFPYGAKGLIAQSFNDNGNLELYNVRSIFPFYGDDIVLVSNPFGGEQRIAIRGQTRYRTLISWLIYIDVWTGDSSLLSTSLEDLKTKIELNYQELIDVKNILNLILDNLNITPPPTPPTTEQQEFFLIN